MIASLRAFEAGQKVITTIDETLRQGRQPGRPRRPRLRRSKSRVARSSSRPTSRLPERMLEGLNSAAAGMAAQQQRLDAVANDLANANTTGYKHDARRLPRPRLHAGGPPAAQGVAHRRRRRRGRRRARRSPRARCSAPTSRSTSPSRATASSASARADGTPGADARRRAAASTATAAWPPSTGALLQPRDHDPRRRRPRPTSRSRPDGTVTADGRRVGRIELVTVRAPQALRSVGDNAFVATAASGAARRRAARRPRSTQGALEASNVDMADAMVAMIESQRAFELASQGDPDGRPDVGDRQRGEAMSDLRPRPQVSETALPAAVRAGTARGQGGLPGRARLRAGAARPARQVDGRRAPARSPRAPTRPPVQDALHRRGLIAQRRPRPRPRSSTATLKERVMSTDARGRAARPPRRADRLRPPPARRSSSTRARRSAPATSTACSAELADDPDRDGPPRPARAGARRGCSQRAGAALGVPATERHARAPVPARHPGRRPTRPASAPPSCAACSPRSPASTASTAR